MNLHKALTLGLATAALFVMSQFAVAQTPNQQSIPQSGGESVGPGITGQGGGSDSTLEIAPQPGLVRKPAVKEIPSERSFNPGENDTSIDSNFRPGTRNNTSDLDTGLNGQDNGQGNSERYRPHARPYLGITVAYRSMCFNGGEEHGLEVLTIDPNSPAAQAGLHAKSGVTGIGAAVTTLSAILPGGSVLANKAMESSGAMGQDGDLIVAVDDKRIRDQSDLEAAMSRLKPGDTMYLTVIRPNGTHETGPHPPAMKIAVHVGAVGEPIANAAPGGDAFAH